MAESLQLDNMAHSTMLDGPDVVRYLAYVVVYLRGVFLSSMFDIEQWSDPNTSSVVGLALNLKVLLSGKLLLTDAFIALLEGVVCSMREKSWVESLQLDICSSSDLSVSETYVFKLVDFIWSGISPIMQANKLGDAIFDLENTMKTCPSLPASKTVMFRLRYSPDCPTCYQPAFFRDGTHAPVPWRSNPNTGAIEYPCDLTSSGAVVVSDREKSLHQMCLEPSGGVKETESTLLPSPGNETSSYFEATLATIPKQSHKRGSRRTKYVKKSIVPSSPWPGPARVSRQLQDFLGDPHKTLDTPMDPTQPLSGYEIDPEILQQSCECGNTSMAGTNCSLCNRRIHHMCYAIPIETNHRNPYCITCYSTKDQYPILQKLLRLRSLWYLLENSSTFPLIADSFNHLGLDERKEEDVAIVAQLWSRLFADGVILKVENASSNGGKSNPAEAPTRLKITLKGLCFPHDQRVKKGSIFLVRFAPDSASASASVWSIYLKYPVFTRRGGDRAISFLRKKEENSALATQCSSTSTRLSTIQPDPPTEVLQPSQELGRNICDPIEDDLRSPTPLSLLVCTKPLPLKLVELKSQSTFFNSQNSSLRLMSFELSLELLRQQSQTVTNCESPTNSNGGNIATPLFLQHC